MAEKQEPFPETVEFSYLTQMWEPFSAENNLVSEYEKAMNMKMDVEWAPVDNYSTRVLTSRQAICRCYYAAQRIRCGYAGRSGRGGAADRLAERILPQPDALYQRGRSGVSV